MMRLDDAVPLANLVHAQRAVEVAEATLHKACVAAERAQRELERNRGLAESEIVSVDVLDELESAFALAEAGCKVAQSEVESARAAEAVAAAELDKTILRAPFDAIIAEDSIEVGEWATPSIALIAAPEVFDLIDAGSLYVSAPMDEVDAARLEVGQPARVTIDPYPDRTFGGRVARVAPYVLDIEQQNRTIEVEVVLEDTEFSATLLPGTSADVEVILAAKENVLRIPTYALLEDRRVLVVENGILVAREVEIGIRNWDFAEITAGLSVNDLVVTSLDRAEVEEGAEVIVENGAEPQ